MPASSTAPPAPPASAPASNSINMAGNIGSNNCLPTAAIFSRFVGRWACGKSELVGEGLARGQLRLGNAFFAG